MVLQRTDCNDHNFIQLVTSLDADLALRDGKDHAFYDQFNSIKGIRYAIVAFLEGKPVGCGAIKEYDIDSMEVKRMYVLPEVRGMGLGGTILKELELWTAELNYTHCVLETGKRQPEAIALYKKSGYKTIPNYGQYQGVENSVCFKKEVYFGKNRTT